MLPAAPCCSVQHMPVRVHVLVPVLGRPERARPLALSLDASLVPGEYDVSLIFLVSEGDDEQYSACEQAGPSRPDPYTAIVVGVVRVPWPAGPGDYARKLNDAMHYSGWADWYFLGADDLRFHPGWLDRAIACHLASGACVVGTNDLGNEYVIQGRHSTHTLVSSRYLECGTIDDPTRVLHEGYDHNFVDTEFIETAIHRQTFEMAYDSHVEHLHPDWGKGQRDATYEKGKARFSDDRQLYMQRRALWTPQQPGPSHLRRVRQGT